MKTPIISGIGTACPELYMKQEEVLAFYKKHDLMPANQRALYEDLLVDGPIQGRYFGMNRPTDVIDEGTDAKNQRYLTQGRKLAGEASISALKEAGVSPGDIGGLVVNSCTGYLCPGLTSYLVQDLGFSPYIKVVDLMGMGCGSALPNLECGCGMLERNGGKPVLCVAVEVCSATHFIDDDPGLTVSNCIFGDGAAAVVIKDNAERDGDQAAPAIVDFETGIFPEYREELRYKSDGGHLRNSLSPRVPVTGGKCLKKVTSRLLTKHNLEVSDIGWWAVHAGGKSVLDQVAKNFDLRKNELAASRDIFAKYGNMSSPTALFVFRELLNRNAVAGPGLLLAFGAGFTAFAALLSSGKGQKTV